MTDEEIIKFFGHPKSQINPLVLRVGIAKKPEWIQGKSRLYDLPRYSVESLEFKVNLDVNDRIVSEVVKGIPIAVETCEGRWHLDQSGFSFETITDAILFRLKL